ncbi:Acyltransferase family protein [Marinomonas aquimarina]|uniref:Acyltransferase family protein n=1 Tax=Marinomonas aquimarina TaxID=295068 RepID=A0A1A8TM35_9GAMM|nr:acyltransferase family protein [Marinomonas aquimarina]SBS34743.1 Acyltransferase family protein [Marinomonas aquimarina]
MILNSVSQSRDNNFNFLRLLCALGVLLAHSHLVFTGQSLEWSLLGVRIDHLLVSVFFAISGFLICKSLLQSDDLKRYFAARALRLLPALLALLLITVLVVGPLFTTLSRHDYFASQLTWDYLLNANLLNIHTQFELTGVFANAPYPNNVNTSLWTLPIEAWLYMMAAMAYCLITLGIEHWPNLNQRVLLSVGVLGLLGLSVIGHTALQHRDDDAPVMLLFICLFYAATLAYSARTKLILRYRYAMVLWLLAPLADKTALFSAYFAIAMTYSVLLLAYRPTGWIRQFNRLGDYSYGVYIYGFLVQQSTLQLWPQASFLGFVLLSSWITLLCAVASWHWLEKPCLAPLKTQHSFKGVRPI